MISPDCPRQRCAIGGCPGSSSERLDVVPMKIASAAVPCRTGGLQEPVSYVPSPVRGSGSTSFRQSPKPNHTPVIHTQGRNPQTVFPAQAGIQVTPGGAGRNPHVSARNPRHPRPPRVTSWADRGSGSLRRTPWTRSIKRPCIPDPSFRLSGAGRNPGAGRGTARFDNSTAGIRVGGLAEGKTVIHRRVCGNWRLDEAGLIPHMVHPIRMRSLARAHGFEAKTDGLDAQVPMFGRAFPMADAPRRKPDPPFARPVAAPQLVNQRVQELSKGSPAGPQTAPVTSPHLQTRTHVLIST